MKTINLTSEEQKAIAKEIIALAMTIEETESRSEDAESYYTLYLKSSYKDERELSHAVSIVCQSDKILLFETIEDYKNEFEKSCYETCFLTAKKAKKACKLLNELFSELKIDEKATSLLFNF